MRVAVVCETSGKVREAFRRRGHYAVSCDLLPADDGSRHHHQGDALLFLAKERFDLLIAHPPCTYLCNSGVQWLTRTPPNQTPGVLYGEQRWQALDRAAEFFLALRGFNIPTAIENPIMHKHGMRRIGLAPTQIVQPYMFGHPELKATCLWLIGLRSLRATNWLPPPYEQRVFEQPPGPDRWKIRSETYQGIADAMAEQWGTEQTDLLF